MKLVKVVDPKNPDDYLLKEPKQVTAEDTVIPDEPVAPAGDDMVSRVTFMVVDPKKSDDYLLVTRAMFDAGDYTLWAERDATPEEPAEPPKRGRGRPRKHPLPEPAVVAGVAPDESPEE